MFILWGNPGVKNGREYVHWLGKRWFDRYFIDMDVKTVFWNYDLYNVVKTSIPKADEPVLYQHYKRVSGAFKYMLTYIFNTPMIDWSQYGYKLDNEKKCYYPAIFMAFKPSLKTKVMNSDDNKENNIRKKNRKSATQLNLLNEAFEEQPFLEDVKLECLTNETKLSKKVIRDWFSKERKRKGTPLQDITI